MNQSTIFQILSTEKSRTNQAQKIFAAYAKEQGITSFNNDECKQLRKWFKSTIPAIDPYFSTKSGNDALCHGLKNLQKGAICGNSTNGNGEQGSNGNGEQGSNGNGEQGSNGNGEQGTNGNGEQGTNGNGEQGTNGNGEQGTNGNGEQGSNGNGEQGTNGNGEQGSNGNGEQGANGNGEQEQEQIEHNKFNEICNLVKMDLPVYLYGPAGTGKTSVCMDVAKKLGLNFYFSASITQEHKLTGFIDANGRYNDTPFFHAFTEGGLFLIDEMDNSAPEVLTLLNAAIAQRMFVIPQYGIVKAHKDFRVIAAGNTKGTGADCEYVSRVQLDSATLNRFIPVSFDYDINIEKAIAKDDKLVDFVHDLRNAIKESGIPYVISYRNIQYFNKLKGVIGEQGAIENCFAGYMDADNLAMVQSNLTTNNKYSKMFKAVQMDA